MFETQDFYNRIHAVVSREINRRNFIDNSEAIAETFQKIAVNNGKLPDHKATQESFSRLIAMPHVESLIKIAADTALKDGRHYILVQDIKAAITAKFCTVWPFCNSDKPD